MSQFPIEPDEKISISKKLFDAIGAEGQIVDYLMDEFDCDFDLGWDEYDTSLEIKGVPDSFELSIPHQEWFLHAGFSKIYVNKKTICDTYSFWDYKENEKCFPAKIAAASLRGPRSEYVFLVSTIRRLQSELAAANARAESEYAKGIEHSKIICQTWIDEFSDINVSYVDTAKYATDAMKDVIELMENLLPQSKTEVK
jgi:hypothetical protein